MVTVGHSLVSNNVLMQQSVNYFYDSRKAGRVKLVVG